MGFSRLKIRTPISVGFATLVGLILILAGIGLFELSVVRSDSSTMALLIDHVDRSLDATNRLEVIRRRDLRGQIDGDAANLADADDATVVLRRERAAAAHEGVSEQRRRSYASLLASLDAHTAYKGRFVQLITAANQAGDKLLRVGETLSVPAVAMIQGALCAAGTVSAGASLRWQRRRTA